jgi:hypothetical protein
MESQYGTLLNFPGKELESFHSYNFDYICDFGDAPNPCNLLKLNGRGERI